MNWEKFKKLSLRAKLQWIIQYYGVAIAIGAIAIFVGIVLVQSLFGPAEDYAIRVMILDDRQSADLCQAFAQELCDALGGECDVTSYLERDDDQRQAFVVRLMSDNLDIVIAPAEQTEQLLQNGFLRSAMQLEADAFYYACTGGSPEQDGALYLGVTASSRKTDNAATAIEYFIRGRE